MQAPARRVERSFRIWCRCHVLRDFEFSRKFSALTWPSILYSDHHHARLSPQLSRSFSSLRVSGSLLRSSSLRLDAQLHSLAPDHSGTELKSQLSDDYLHLHAVTP